MSFVGICSIAHSGIHSFHTPGRFKRFSICSTMDTPAPFMSRHLRFHSSFPNSSLCTPSGFVVLTGRIHIGEHICNDTRVWVVPIHTETRLGFDISRNVRSTVSLRLTARSIKTDGIVVHVPPRYSSKGQVDVLAPFSDETTKPWTVQAIQYTKRTNQRVILAVSNEDDVVFVCKGLQKSHLRCIKVLNFPKKSECFKSLLPMDERFWWQPLVPSHSIVDDSEEEIFGMPFCSR